jgi:hypothetical protein
VAAAAGQAHAAVFTSRAESGTNLFATQCLAAGLPTVLSRNTGHEDLAKVVDDAAAATGAAVAAVAAAAATTTTESLALSVGRAAGTTTTTPDGASTASTPPVQAHGTWEGVEGWRETDPNEVAQALLRLYKDYVAAAGPYAPDAWRSPGRGVTPLPGGVRLVTWTILAAINWCL